MWNLLRPIIGLFWTLWGVLDGLRKVLSLTFLLGLVIFVLAAVEPDNAAVPQNVALVLTPKGALVEQLSGDPIDRAIAKARGLQQQEVLVKDLIDTIHVAKDDDRIALLVLDLEGLSGGGLSKLQDIADEIILFKASGKKVIAFGDGFTRSQYYLAAHADEIYMHPMGFVYIDGYSRYMPYYRTAIENLSIDFNVWTVGEYKSFVEPITRDGMSDDDREAASEYLGALWNAYQADVTAARGLNGSALQRYADNAVELLKEANGDSARMALDYGLVDELLAQDEINARLKALVGGNEEDANADNFSSIGHDFYLRAIQRNGMELAAENSVGVIVASGVILDGSQAPGTIGGDSTAALIRRATNNDQVDALVLRVDSSGGSAFASEVVLRELEVFQESGRPLVVSMGSVAASGGYWISMSANEIWASPTTLTGSIGIGATLPTFQRSLNRLGINVDGTGTTAIAGQLNPMRELGPELVSIIGQSIQHGYDQFVSKVARHRDKSVEAIDEVARGRVWIATDAQDHGLIDHLGNLGDAIASAAELAGLENDQYEVIYLEKRLEFTERIALQLAISFSPLIDVLGLDVTFPFEFQQLVGALVEPFKMLDRLNDPRDIYAYCFCDVR
ncbi:MAG: signal peptide peptidase SppA [Candidatus Rariloculaceae bacterium]